MKRTQPSASAMTSKHHTFAVFILSVTITAILVLRCFNAVFYPVLHCEDGTEMVAYFSNNPHPSEIFRFYEGYVSLIPNAIGFFTVHIFPLHTVPYLMTAFSLALAVVALSLFSSGRYRFIMPDDASRVIVCLIVALFPLGNHALITSLTYSLWHILLISLLLATAPLPKSSLAKAGQFIFLALAICSHPLSVVLVPVCVVLLFTRPTLPDRISNMGLIILAAAYLSFGVQPNHISMPDVTTLLLILEHIAVRVLFEPVFGNSLRILLQNANMGFVINLCALAVLCIVAAVFGTGRPGLKNKRPLFGFLLFVIGALTSISVVTRSMTFDNLYNPWGHRYFYNQQLLVVFTVACGIVCTINWKKIPHAGKWILIPLLAAYIGYLNIHNASFFRTSKEEGIAIIQFLQSVDMQSGNNGTGEDSSRKRTFDRGGRWDITINLGDNTEQATR